MRASAKQGRSPAPYHNGPSGVTAVSLPSGKKNERRLEETTTYEKIIEVLNSAMRFTNLGCGHLIDLEEVGEGLDHSGYIVPFCKPYGHLSVRYTT